MAIGLKLRDVRRFGAKVQKGVHTFARKLGKTADVVGAIATPLATAIAGPAGGAMVAQGVGAVKKMAGTAERLTGKGVAKGTELFKQIQQPVLGARELIQGAKTAITNPEQGQIMIGDTLAKRFPSKNTRGLQRDTPVNDWAPELPFAGQ